MAETTKIAWCDATVNLWWGCQHAGDECHHCYAEAFSKRVGKSRAWQDVRYEVPSAFGTLDKLQRKAAKQDEPLTVFVQSMGDIFELPQQLVTWQGRFTGRGTNDVRDRFFSLIDAGLWPDLVFLLLTKRPGLIGRYVPGAWLAGDWPANVWTGTSVGTVNSLPQIERLAKWPGRHFVSFEPLLEFLPLLAATPPDWDAFESATIGMDGWDEPEEFIEECEEECDWVNYGRDLVHSREHREWLRDRERYARQLHLRSRINWGVIGCESKGSRVGRLPEGGERQWICDAADLALTLRAAGVPAFVKQIPIDGKVSHDPGAWPEALRFREFPEWLSSAVKL